MKKITLLLLFFISLRLWSQDVEIGKRTTIVFVSPEIIASDNFVEEEFTNWAKAVQQAAANLMKTEKTNSIVKIIADWQKGKTCSYNVGACPSNTGLDERMSSALKNVTGPVAKIAPFQLLFTFKFNDGCKSLESFAPAIQTAGEKLNSQLSTGSLVQRKEVLRNWALNDVIPILSYYTSSVSEQFMGVRKTGEVLTKRTFLNKETNNVTDKNPLYWRGVMEMSKGNLIIPVSKIFMHVANDEFDLARRYIGGLFRFADKESLASAYLLELNNNLNLFYRLHDSLVRQGIALHDAGKFDKAIEVYNGILADYPNSAWARYELYFSTDAKNSAVSKEAKKSTALWNESKASVYTADPLYPMGGGAKNAKEGYVLFRHLKVSELFKDNKNVKSDMIAYAGIALDLKYYAFAAHLYWYLLSLFPEEKYNGHGFLVYFLYSLQKQGLTEVQSFFKTDYKNEFTAIDSERTEAMKNDPGYKSFKE